MLSAARFNAARNAGSRRASITNSGLGVVTTWGTRAWIAWRRMASASAYVTSSTRTPRMSTWLALECPPVATLLTGVGYIGATLLRRLVQRGADALPIVALDNFFSTTSAQIQAVLPADARLIEGDVADPVVVARAFDALGRQDVVVYHLAAQPSAAIAVKDPEVTERSNLVGARVVLQAALDRHARVVFGGSFRVYGDDLVGRRIVEDQPYGRVGDLSHLSKIYVEQLARMIGVPFISVRLGVTYGLSPIMKTTPGLMTVPACVIGRNPDVKLPELL